MVKPASPAKKVAPKPAKSAELPAIGGTAIKQKAGEEKPKVKRPFGELEGWSSAAEAEKKVMPNSARSILQRLFEAAGRIRQQGQYGHGDRLLTTPLHMRCRRRESHRA